MLSPTLPLLSTLRKRVFTLLFLSVIIITAAGAARALLNGERPAAAAATRTRPDRGGAARVGVEAELITAGPDGFQPSEITRPKGRFYLVVDNLSESPALDLRLSREAGNSLHEVRVPRGQADWTELLDLAPGTYVLREAAHPDWECRLVVTP